MLYILIIIVIITIIAFYLFRQFRKNKLFDKLYQNIINESQIIHETPYNLEGVIKLGNENQNGYYQLTLNKYNSNVSATKYLFSNQNYHKFDVTGVIKGSMTLIYPLNNGKQITHKTPLLVLESPHDYETYTKQIAYANDKTWIQNIFNGINESERVLYMCDDYVLLPNIYWTNDNINELYCLVIFKRPDLMSIRNLRRSDIKLLEDAFLNSTAIIEKTYGLQKNRLKAFFHYHPSTWQLHMHLINNTHKNVASSVEYSHSIINVLYNLQIDDLYYAKATLQREKFI
jgi:hypothetical protein